MSAPEQQTTINPTSYKIRLAYRFHHALKNLNNGGRNTKASAFENTQIRQRSNRVKIAAYTSMASVAGSRRAWSRAILWKIRNQRARNKKTVVVDHKISNSRRRRLHRVGFTRRRNANPKREYVDPIGDSGQEVKLRKLVPGAESMDAYGLLDETADYIKCLATQVEVMRTLLDLYSTF